MGNDRTIRFAGSSKTISVDVPSQVFDPPAERGNMNPDYTEEMGRIRNWAGEVGEAEIRKRAGDLVHTYGLESGVGRFGLGAIESAHGVNQTAVYLANRIVSAVKTSSATLAKIKANLDDAEATLDAGYKLLEEMEKSARKEAGLSEDGWRPDQWDLWHTAGAILSPSNALPLRGAPRLLFGAARPQARP